MAGLSQASVDAINAAQSDEERTRRMFVGLMSSALGVDNLYTGSDAAPVGSAPGGFMYANPDGTASVAGQPVSNVKKTATVAGLSPLTAVLLIAGLLWLAH